MLKVNPTQWLRYRTKFQLPRSVELTASTSKVFRPPAQPVAPPLIKPQGRSIGTQTEATFQHRIEHPPQAISAAVATNASTTQQQQQQPVAAVTAAFQDLLGVTSPNATKPDDLKNTFYQRELPTSLTRFASPEGKKLFREAMDDGHAEGFFPLTGNFTTQSEPAYCGPSSCKCVMRSRSLTIRSELNFKIHNSGHGIECLGSGSKETMEGELALVFR